MALSLWRISCMLKAIKTAITPKSKGNSSLNRQKRVNSLAWRQKSQRRRSLMSTTPKNFISKWKILNSMIKNSLKLRQASKIIWPKWMKSGHSNSYPKPLEFSCTNINFNLKNLRNLMDWSRCIQFSTVTMQEKDHRSSRKKSNKIISLSKLQAILTWSVYMIKLLQLKKS